MLSSIRRSEYPHTAIDTPIPSRSLKTESLYLRRAKNILAEIEIKSGTQDITAVDIAEWLELKSSQITPSSLRQYRSSLIYHIENQVASGVMGPGLSNRAISTMRAIHGCAQSISRTSSIKAKSITPKKIDALIAMLAAKRSKFAKSASLIFQSSMIAGLRPSEWFSAVFRHDPQSGDGLLLVQNAKSTNGRSFGESREIIIPDGPDCVTVQNTIQYLASLVDNGVSIDSIYNESRRIIRSLGLVHNGKRISLYTARHQFVANMKNIYPREEVALLLGHASAETAGIHYGKRASGHPEYRNAARLNKNDLSQNNMGNK